MARGSKWRPDNGVRKLLTTPPPDIERGLLAELVARWPIGEVQLERILVDAIRVTWKTAAHFQETRPR